MERQEDEIEIPEQIDLQRIEDEISEDIKDMIFEEERKMKKRQKNRIQKEKKKLRQLELECRLEKVIECIITKKLTVKLTKDKLGEIIESFVGKSTRFFQILDQSLKRHLDRALDEFWKDVEETEDIEELEVDFDRYAIHHKIMMLKFYKVLIKLQQSNNEIVKLLKLFFEKSPDDERESKYSVDGLIMSQYIYLLQEDTSLREIIRTWKNMEKNQMDLDMTPLQEKVLRNFDYDRYFEAFQMLESESKKDNQPKPKRKRKNKKKEESVESQESKSEQIPIQFTQEEIDYNNCLYKIQRIGQQNTKVKIKISKQFMESLRPI